jgi:hypothetical protein
VVRYGGVGGSWEFQLPSTATLSQSPLSGSMIRCGDTALRSVSNLQVSDPECLHFSAPCYPQFVDDEEERVGNMAAVAVLEGPDWCQPEFLQYGAVLPRPKAKASYAFSDVPGGLFFEVPKDLRCCLVHIKLLLCNPFKGDITRGEGGGGVRAAGLSLCPNSLDRNARKVCSSLPGAVGGQY